MLDMYTAILSIVKATMFVDQIFSRFDQDNSGTIDFKVSQTIFIIQCLVSTYDNSLQGASFLSYCVRFGRLCGRKSM